MTASRFCLFGSLFLLVVCLLGLESTEPLFFLHDDNASSYIANYLLDFHTLFHTGRLAEIDYDQYGGAPFMEQGQSAVLYPPVYLCVALATHLNGDARCTIEWMVFLHLAAGLIGIYYLLRSWGVEPPLAGLAGLYWALSPFVLILSSNWSAVTYIVCYMPWIMLGIDRFWARPDWKSCGSLALPVILFVLTGAVQFLAYVLLFTGLYGLMAPERWRRVTLRHVFFALLAAFLVFAGSAPTLFPILHASSVAAHRGTVMALKDSLLYSLQFGEFLHTQLFIFTHHTLDAKIRSSNSSYFLSIEIFLLPFAILGWIKADRPTAGRALRFSLLAMLALFFSTRGHRYLSLLPVFNRFRWPFKVFIYWKFFLLLFLALCLSSWARNGLFPQRRLFLACGVMFLLLMANLDVAALNQYANLLSHVQLPSLKTVLASVIDPTKGRAVGIGRFEYDGNDLDGYLAYNFGTTYGLPQIGGYDSIVGKSQAAFGLDLNAINVYMNLVTPEVRQELNRKSVRYWILNMNTELGHRTLMLPDLKRLLQIDTRVIVENEEAAPLATYGVNSNQAAPLRYEGNSLLIDLDGFSGPVAVSLSQTDGWYYRCDGGPWQKPSYLNDHILCPVTSKDRTLEVSYFDPYFRRGVITALSCLGLLALGWVSAVLFRKVRRPGEQSFRISPPAEMPASGTGENRRGRQPPGPGC